MKIRIFIIFVAFGYAMGVPERPNEVVVAHISQALGCDSFRSFPEVCDPTIDCSITDHEEKNEGGTQKGHSETMNCSGSPECQETKTITMPEEDQDCCDQDYDGYERTGGICSGGDCVDEYPYGYYINPGAQEVCGNGIDDDCDGGTDAQDPQMLALKEECEMMSWCWDTDTCTCSLHFFIIVDGNVKNGVRLTDVQDGAVFDIHANDMSERLSWTLKNSDDAFLVIDRNGNGRIDNGREFFGSTAPQSSSIHGNAFLALAELDKPAHGGNGDGRISRSDAAFSWLRLWQDKNHNGRSEPRELHKLEFAGIMSLDLDAREYGREDQYGNKFQYRTSVQSAFGKPLDRWAYSVIVRTKK